MDAGAATSIYYHHVANGREAKVEASESSSKQSPRPGVPDKIAWESNDKQSLLPGVPNEITMNHILTKLPWRTVYVLALLGRAWRAALRSRDVHDARVRASTTQTLVAMIHDDPALSFRNLGYALSLYDCSGDTWHLLPQIPGIRSGFPEGCGCISLHGKLYIIGGRGEALVHFSKEVYEFDPAGMGRWRQCASMKSGRVVFACDVKDGKIYVFGGMGAECAAEVYDPVQDIWHGIAPMLSNRIQHKVVHIRDEFYVHMGKYFTSDRHWNDAHFAEVYDTSTDQWRRVENFTGNNPTCAKVVEAVLVLYGRILKILDDWLYIYHEPSRSWGPFQSVSWDVLKSRRGSINQSNSNGLAASAIAVRGELLALVYGLSADNEMVLIPLRSAGFGHRSLQMMWGRIQSSLHFRSGCRWVPLGALDASHSEALLAEPELHDRQIQKDVALLTH